MPNEAYLSSWTTYQSAWSDISDAQRVDLLEASVSADCTYTDPGTDERHGHAELVETIRNTQAAYPGVSFRNDQLTGYNGQALSEWTMYDAGGAEIVKGGSYARFGADGRLTNMVGFFVPPGGLTTERPFPPTRPSISWDIYQGNCSTRIGRGLSA